MNQKLINASKKFYFDKRNKELLLKINKIIIISILSLILFLMVYYINNGKSFSSGSTKPLIPKSEFEKQRQQTNEKQIKNEIKAINEKNTINEIKAYNETEIKEESKLNTTLSMCVVAKRENRYIREFVEYYKKMKVDKIFLYDNNEENGETFDEVLSDYIKDGYVNITNYRGLNVIQHKAYRDCYRRHNDSFDWFIFVDVDEFIYLKDFKDIKSFVSDKRFDKCERIQLNWLFYTDNNLLYYENKPVQERFTEKEFRAQFSKFGDRQEIKSMIRGHNPNVNIHCIHVIDKHLKSCNGFGIRKKVIGLSTLISDYKFYYIKHYYSKSTEEFIDKILRKSAVHNFTVARQMAKVKRYFKYSHVTKEKLDFIENRTKLNLSSLRYRVRNIIGYRYINKIRNRIGYRYINKTRNYYMD